MAKARSKRYKEAAKLLDISKSYSLKEAVALLKKFPGTKFDQTVEVNLHTSIDPKKSDQLIRGTVSLPHGTGRKVRIAVFCKGEQEKEAKAAGADFVGAEDLIEKVNNGFLDFDAAVASPDIMKDLSRLGKILGPRGLMPSPKTGTVTQNVSAAVRDIKGGKIEFKVDKQSGIHAGIGKINFTEDQILENASKVIEAITHAKPASVKGNFIKSVSISCSMGPGIKVAL
jgi:large subunit ribosomal protein L1